jgi:hypothetical protein
LIDGRRIDADVHDSLFRQPFGGGVRDSGVFAVETPVVLIRVGPLIVPRVHQEGVTLADVQAVFLQGLFHVFYLDVIRIAYVGEIHTDGVAPEEPAGITKLRGLVFLWMKEMRKRQL